MSDARGHSVAIVGATGAVGIEMVKVLHNRRFPVATLKLLASARSASKKVTTPYGEKTIEEFSLDAVQSPNCQRAILPSVLLILRDRIKLARSKQCHSTRHGRLFEIAGNVRSGQRA